MSGRVGFRGLPLIHDKTVDEWGTVVLGYFMIGPPASALVAGAGLAGGGGGAAAAGGGGAAAGGDGAAAGGGAAGGGGIAGTTGTVSIDEIDAPVTYTVSGVPVFDRSIATVHVSSGVTASVWGKYSIALPLSMEPMFTMKVTVWGHLPGKTPWYKNPCIMGALGSGAANIGVDALGAIPGEKLASVLFKEAEIAKGIKYGQGAVAGGGIGNALADADWWGVGLGVVGAIPNGIGQFFSAVSLGRDGSKTWQAVKKCN